MRALAGCSGAALAATLAHTAVAAELPAMPFGRKEAGGRSVEYSGGSEIELHHVNQFLTLRHDGGAPVTSSD
jgi:hypothetical protein